VFPVAEDIPEWKRTAPCACRISGTHAMYAPRAVRRPRAPASDDITARRLQRGFQAFEAIAEAGEHWAIVLESWRLRGQPDGIVARVWRARFLRIRRAKPRQPRR